ncbi:hypothetical protein ACQEVZ_08085 [Dactylosporangium sp. CA-152071]|uniref:hypothetical protein n=1 Tax=Dactylosporangium sp. CA-152071 TaxID=3239933 RepID=UPI003D8B8AAC
MPVTAFAAGSAVVFAMAVAGKVSSRSFTRLRRSAAALRPGPGRPPAAAAVPVAGPGTSTPSLVRAVAGGAVGLILASLEDIVSLLSIPPVPAKGAGR